LFQGRFVAEGMGTSDLHAWLQHTHASAWLLLCMELLNAIQSRTRAVLMTLVVGLVLSVWM